VVSAETKIPLRILVVDDNPTDRAMYRDLLDQHPKYAYRFEEASLGKTGLEQYGAAQPDCVLLDYQLPDLNGLEFLTQICGKDGTSAVPVIMLTGYGNETIVAEAIRAGAADYVPKAAVSTKSLERAITNAVEKYRMRAAIEAQRRELERTNAELWHKNEEIRSFYHMLSHELKTPLTAAREFVSLVLDGLAGSLNSTQREYLGIVKESCDQITFNINDLLDAARADTGKLYIVPQPIAMANVVSHVLVAMAPQAHEKGIELQQDIAPDLPLVYIDEKRITQVLTNLLGNALKFTPADGEVIVRVDNDPQRPAFVLVSVSDTGQGIEPEQLGYIFDRLYQVRSDETAIGGGLGLGLHICREVIKLHRGTIWATSTPGQGSTFFFTLPKHGPCNRSEAGNKELVS
jgi:signal transduction histidine kinase